MDRFRKRFSGLSTSNAPQPQTQFGAINPSLGQVPAPPRFEKTPDQTTPTGSGAGDFQVSSDIRRVTGKDPNYEFISSLGQGGFGAVAKVKRVSDGKVMVCKSIDCSSHPAVIELASREVSTWKSFAASEKYIANFSECAWNERTQTMRLYMEFYEGGDLQKIIDECRHEDTTVHPFIGTYWAMETARGVKACHDYGIIHRDIKPANVLLSMSYKYNDMLWGISDGQKLTDDQKKLAADLSKWLETRPSWCHITDFGLGKFSNAAFGSRHTMATYAGMLGTPGYIAPETVGDNGVFSIRSDVYSLGCLLYSLCSCRQPPSLGLPGGVRYIPPQAIPEGYPKRLKDIILRCMETEVEKRPNSRDVANEISEAAMDLINDSKFGITKARLDAIVSGNPTSSQAAPIPPWPPESENPYELDPADFADLFEEESVAKPIASKPVYPSKDKVVLQNQLRQAVYLEDLDTIKQLVAAGAPVSICAFDEKGVNGKWGVRGPFTKEGLARAKKIQNLHYLKDFSLFVFAIITGSVPIVEFLLKHNPQYEADDEHVGPLFVAAYMDKPDIIDLLVNKGSMWIDMPDQNFSRTPLFRAVEYKSYGAIAKFLELGADVDVPDFRKNLPLHMFFHPSGRSDENKTEASIKLVLDRAPNLVNSQNVEGMTPLHHTIEWAVRPGIIKMFLEAGADPTIKNEKGVKASDLRFPSWASNERKKEIKAIFVSHGISTRRR